MTIAACYLSPEGVVLGADSAVSFGSRNHFFHGQKIFEVGNGGKSTLGMAMWGLGSLGEVSYRTLIARFSDEVVQHPGESVKILADRWRELFWEAYTSELKPVIDQIKALTARADLTEEEIEERDDLISSHSGGFCLGGYSSPDRIPEALAMTYAPDQDTPGSMEEVQIGTPEFWGQPAEYAATVKPGNRPEHVY